MKVRPVLGELSRFADVVISPSGVPIIPCTKLEITEKWQVCYLFVSMMELKVIVLSTCVSWSNLSLLPRQTQNL
jgi:hypothetical protein